MRYEAHDYQKYATAFILTHPVAAVFLEMGLGKSVITLTALFDLILDQFLIRKVLVIAPLRVARDTWPSEIKKWDHLAGLTYSVVVGSETERRAALARTADVYIINRENVDWLITKSKIPFDFDMIVIDELSSFKSYQAKRFKSLLKARPVVKRIVGLTGTPSSNGLMDLWAEFRVLDLGQRLGRYITHYRNAFFRPDKRNGEVIYSYKPLPGAEDEIYKRISDITISMKSCDYLTLPECVINEVPVLMDEKEMAVYDGFREDMVAKIKDQEIDASNAAVLSGKLLQMANGAIYNADRKMRVIHDQKLQMLSDLIEQANGQNVLVAYWFQHDHERIWEYLTEQGYQPRDLKSDQDIADWNAGKIQVGLISPASAGHGLNIQRGGHILIWFSLVWSLEMYQQTNARLWRQGQKEVVTIHHILTRDTVDGDVLDALKHKDTTQQNLISAVKAHLTI